MIETSGPVFELKLNITDSEVSGHMGILSAVGSFFIFPGGGGTLSDVSLPYLLYLILLSMKSDFFVSMT